MPAADRENWPEQGFIPDAEYHQQLEDRIWALEQASGGGGGGSSVFAQSIGNGAATSFNVNHALGSMDVLVQVFEVVNGEEVYPGIRRVNANTAEISFSVAPATNEYRVLVIG